MYKIPASFPLHKLIGQSIQSVLFINYNILLQFSDGSSKLNFSGAFVVGSGDLSLSVSEVGVPESDFGLIKFLNLIVTNSVFNSSDESLKIYFGEDKFIQVFGDQNFESFSLTVDDNRVIV